MWKTQTLADWNSQVTQNGYSKDVFLLVEAHKHNAKSLLTAEIEYLYCGLVFKGLYSFLIFYKTQQ